MVPVYSLIEVYIGEQTVYPVSVSMITSPKTNTSTFGDLSTDDGWGQEEDEEDDEEQNLCQKDNVDVTNFLHLIHKNMTPPLPHQS